MTKRERRRHDRWRMVEKAKRIVRGWYTPLGLKRDVAGHARRLADNLAICSCHMCRYEKHMGIPKISEQRRIDALDSAN